MRRNLFIVCLCIGVMAIAGHVGAVTLDFDDLAGDATAIPNGYGGLNWDNFGSFQGTLEPGSGYEYGVVSSPNVAFSLFADTGVVSSSGLFNFESVYLTAAWVDGLTVDVAGYYLGSTDPNFDSLLPDVSLTVTLSNTAPSLVLFNWFQVAEVWFSPDVGGSLTDPFFVMDDFTYTSVLTNPVPEPASMLLVGTGLVGIAAFRKRFKRS